MKNYYFFINKGEEHVSNYKPHKISDLIKDAFSDWKKYHYDEWYTNIIYGDFGEDYVLDAVAIPKGSIKKLIGRNINNDEVVEWQDMKQ